MAQSAGLINFANAPVTVGGASAATLTATNVTVAGSLTANAVASTSLTVSGNIAVAGNLALTTGTMTLGTTSLTGTQLATIEALPYDMANSNQFNQGLKGLNMYTLGGNVTPYTGNVTVNCPPNRTYTSVQIADLQKKNTFTVDETKVYPPLYNMNRNPETNYMYSSEDMLINEKRTQPVLSYPYTSVGFNFNGLDSSGFYSPAQTFTYVDASGVSFPNTTISEPSPVCDTRNRCTWPIYVPGTTTSYSVHVNDVSGWSMTVTPFAAPMDVKLMKDRMSQYFNLDDVAAGYGMYSIKDSSMNYLRCTAPQKAIIDELVNAQIDSSLNTIRNTTMSLTAPGGDVMNFKYSTYADAELDIMDGGARCSPTSGNSFGVVWRPIAVGGHYVPPDASGAVYISAMVNYRYREREYTRVCHGSLIHYLDAYKVVIKSYPILDNQFYNCPPTNIKELPKSFDGLISPNAQGNHGVGTSFMMMEHLPQHTLKTTINLQLDTSGGAVVSALDASNNPGYLMNVIPDSGTVVYVRNQDYTKGTNVYYRVRQHAYQMVFGGHFDKDLDMNKTRLVYTPSTRVISGDIFYVKPRLLSIPDSTNPDYQSVNGWPCVYVGINVTIYLTSDFAVAFGNINTHYVLTRSLTTGLYLDTSGGYTGTPAVTTKKLYGIASAVFDDSKDADLSLHISQNDNSDGMYFQGKGEYNCLIANPAWMQLDAWCRAGVDASGGTAMFTPKFNLTQALYDSSSTHFGGMSGRDYYSATYKLGVDQGPSIVPNTYNAASWVVYDNDVAAVNFTQSGRSYAQTTIENNVIQSYFYEKVTGGMISPWNSFQYNIDYTNGVPISADTSGNPTLDASGNPMWTPCGGNFNVRFGTTYANLYIDQALNYKVVATGFPGWEVPVKLVTPQSDKGYYIMNASYRNCESQQVPGGLYINENYVIDASNHWIPFLDMQAGPNGVFFESKYWTVDTSGLYPTGSGYLMNRQAMVDDFGYDNVYNIYYTHTCSYFSLYMSSLPPSTNNCKNPNPLVPLPTNPGYNNTKMPLLPDYIRKAVILASRVTKNKQYRQYASATNVATNC